MRCSTFGMRKFKVFKQTLGYNFGLRSLMRPPDGRGLFPWPCFVEEDEDSASVRLLVGFGGAD